MDVQLAGSSRMPHRPLKKLSMIAKRPPVNIDFQDLTYTVRDGGFRSGEWSKNDVNRELFWWWRVLEMSKKRVVAL